MNYLGTSEYIEVPSGTTSIAIHLDMDEMPTTLQWALYLYDESKNYLTESKSGQTVDGGAFNDYSTDAPYSWKNFKNGELRGQMIGTSIKDKVKYFRFMIEDTAKLNNGDFAQADLDKINSITVYFGNN